MKTKIFQALVDSHLFSGLPETLLEDIAGSVTRKKLAAGEMLFQKGDHANALWGVLSGRVVIEVRTDDGKELVLDSYESGEIFGEVGVLDFGPRRVDATAETDSELFRLDRANFLEHLQSSPEFCFRVFTLLCTHLRNTTGTLEDTALYKLSGRLAKRLLMMSGEETGENGNRYLNISQSELARLLGVNREAVNRQLREWERSGWIALGREKVEIIERKKLAGFAAPIPQAMPDAWDVDRPLHFGPTTDWNVVGRDDPESLPERRSVTIMAIDCGTYASLFKTDSMQAIKRIKSDFQAMDRGIRSHGGRVIWSAGERTIAEFDEARSAMRAALQIHRAMGDARQGTRRAPDSFCRIGLHRGEVLISEGRVIGEPINVAISLTRMLSSGGICFTDALAEDVDKLVLAEYHPLGKLGLEGAGRMLEVYSVKPFTRSARLKLASEKIVPPQYRVAVALGGAIIALVLVWFSGRYPDHPTPDVVGPPAPSVAVLPFEFDGDVAHAWMVSGLEDSIRSDLASMPGIFVVGRQSSHYFRERDATVKDISESLKVNFVLRGFAVAREDQLEVRAWLMKTPGGENVWNRIQSVPARDFDDMRAAITLGVRQELNGGKPVDTTWTPPQFEGASAEARSLYLMARHHLSQSFGRDHAKALPLLKAAVVSDPEFAPAWVTLSSLYESDGLDHLPEYDPGTRKALHDEAWEKAVVLAPDSADVLSKEAYMALRNGELEAASVLAERAVAIHPNSPLVLNALWGVLAARDNWAAAMEVSGKMLSLDPLNSYYMARHVAPLTAIDQCDKVLEMAEKVHVLYPGNPVAHIWNANCASDRATAVDASMKAWPYGAPLALWYGLEDIRQGLDGLSPRHAANHHAYMANYDLARNALDEMVPIGQRGAFPQLNWEFLVAMGELEALAGEYARAIGYFEQALSLLPVGRGDLVFPVTLRQWISSYRQSASALALLHAYRQTGMDRKAGRIARVFRNDLDKRRQGLEDAGAADAGNIHLYAEAQFYAIEGKVKEALATLEAWAGIDKALFTYVRRDPFFESLHNEPRFWEVVAAVESELMEIRKQYRSRFANNPSLSGPD